MTVPIHCRRLLLRSAPKQCWCTASQLAMGSLAYRSHQPSSYQNAPAGLPAQPPGLPLLRPPQGLATPHLFRPACKMSTLNASLASLCSVSLAPQQGGARQVGILHAPDLVLEAQAYGHNILPGHCLQQLLQVVTLLAPHLQAKGALQCHTESNTQSRPPSST